MTNPLKSLHRAPPLVPAGARFLLSFLLICCVAPLACAQTITSLSPSTVTAGGPGFTLTVNGTGFDISMIVRVNGANRATTFVNPNQLTALIPSTDIAVPGTLTIIVFVPATATSSNPAILTVSAAQPRPTLISAAPGFVSPGAAQVRLTLRGTNFRPGATAVISPPLGATALSTGNTQASDISVDDVSVIGSTLMVALISVSPSTPVGLRAIDVMNADGTTTGTALGILGTSKPLSVTSANSLGAPLNVTTIAVTYPRDGALIAQGDEFYGGAELAATGSGTVIGGWFWDGLLTEQFSVVLSGGQSVIVRAQHSFPTSLLGVHTVELRILQPNRVASRPITVVVNPGNFSLERLLYPPFGARVLSSSPPQLRWAPVPGVAKYEVGFAAQPYFSSVTDWHEVTDNRWTVPQDVWQNLADGELYWTVRAVEMSGQKRKPLPMRLLLRFPADALKGAGAPTTLTAQGNPLLEWKGLTGHQLYQITICADQAGIQIVRRYLTSAPQVDLRALKGKLDPAKTYYWFVEALDQNGNIELTGPIQPLLFPGGPSSHRLGAGAPHVVLASYEVVSRANYRGVEARESLAEIASLSGRTPVPDSTSADPKALISAEFSSPPNAFDLTLQVDGTDVTSLSELSGAKFSYSSAVPLTDGAHTVTLTLGKDTSSWKFTVKAAAAAPEPAHTDAESPAQTGPSTQKLPGAGPGPTPIRNAQIQTQIGVNTQWVSGSAQDTNAVSFGQQLNYQQGELNTQANGSGMLNSVLGPDSARHSHGLVNNYITQTGASQGKWGYNLRFGIVAPALYVNSQFVTPASPRQGLEASLATPGGNFGFYANTGDAGLGGGSGFAFHQQILGASWDLPLPKKFLELRVMWLSAKDTSAAATAQTNLLNQSFITNNTLSSGGGGDLYGGLLLLHLSPHWLVSSEYAWGYNSSDFIATPLHQSGRAWRSGITGTAGPATLNVSFIDVSENFGSPANPHLSALSTPDRRGPSAILSFATRAGNFSFSDTYLQSNFNQANVAEQAMHSASESWSRTLGKVTTVNATAHETFTTTGDIPPAIQSLTPESQLAFLADQRDLGANLGLTRQVGKTLSVNFSGARDWFRNALVSGGNTITSSITGGASWTARPFLSINGNIGANWVAGDKNTVGGTRSLSGFLQPTLIWQRTGLQVQPIASLNQTRTELDGGLLTSNLLSGQYGGRLSWTMPGELKFSTFSFEGDYADSKNPIVHFEQRSTTLFLLWTISWARNQTLYDGAKVVSLRP